MSSCLLNSYYLISIQLERVAVEAGDSACLNWEQATSGCLDKGEPPVLDLSPVPRLVVVIYCNLLASLLQFELGVSGMRALGDLLVKVKLADRVDAARILAVSDDEPELVKALQRLEGLARGVLSRSVRLNRLQKSTVAVVLVVGPLRIQAVQVVAHDLLQLLTNEEGLIGDIDVDAQAQTTWSINVLWQNGQRWTRAHQ